MPSIETAWHVRERVLNAGSLILMSLQRLKESLVRHRLHIVLHLRRFDCNAMGHLPSVPSLQRCHRDETIFWNLFDCFLALLSARFVVYDHFRLVFYFIWAGWLTHLCCSVASMDRRKK